MSVSTARRKRVGPHSGLTLPKGPIMAHVGFQGARHMHPERMPSAKREKTVSLRLFDVTQDTIDHVENHSGSVKRLMINGLKLTSLSEDLVNKMTRLEKLDLGDNQLGDTSLPDAFKTLENLVELNLNNNKFTKVPPSIRKLRNLIRLNLSHNGIDSLKGLEKLKKMQVLLLDHNKFNSVFKDVSHMRKLEILDCSDNSIREVGLDVRNLKNIRELNISRNKISVLPTDVFQLSSLESLKASHNQISKIPVFHLNPHHRHTIAEIDLAGNTLHKFPGHLLLLTKKLDLSANRIKALDWNKMKKVEVTSGQDLFVDGNPLTFPPEDVCECGLKSMMQFFQETQLNVKVYQGVKILVLGSHDSGKTSFVQTLADGQPRLSEEMYEKSAGIELTEVAFDNIQDNEPDEPEFIAKLNKQDKQEVRDKHEKRDKREKRGRLEKLAYLESVMNGDAHNGEAESVDKRQPPPMKSLNLCIWDFCGYPFYLFPHYMFFEQPAIAILTFNMHTYKSERFEELVGSWFDWMISKTNKLCVLLVGTHADKLKKKTITSVCDEVKLKLQAHAERQRQIVQKRIDTITEKPHISQTLSSQLNSYSMLLQEKFVVQKEVIVTSAANNIGYDTVRASIELLSKDSKQFPNVLRSIPTFWLDVENWAEERGNAMTVPVMKFETFKEEAGEKFGMKHLLNTIVQYLHETGKVLWFSGQAAMKDYIILRPAWFFDMFRSVFRHDMEEKLTIEVEDSFKTIGITQSKYDQLRDEFLTEGVVDRDLLKCMMSNLLPLETNGPFYEVIDILMNHLDLGYLVSKRAREQDYNLDPDTENMHSRKYLLPWFRKVAEPEKVQAAWKPLENKRRLAGVCRFPKYMPPGLFEMLCVRAHKGKNRLKFLSHWGGGFHARHKEEKVQLMFSYYKHAEDNGATLRFELRDECDPNVDEVPASTMWTILLPILMDFEELLHSYTGVLVERLMECPNCRELSFLGEWLTPKETQGLPVRPCEECMEDVDTAFLVQPREKKRDDVRLNLARMRRQRRDAMADAEVPDNMTQLKAPLRHGRRAAVMPTDMLFRSSVSTAGVNEPETEAAKSQNSDEEIDCPVPRSLLIGLSGLDLPPFLTGIQSSESNNDDIGEEEEEVVLGTSTPVPDCCPAETREMNGDEQGTMDE